MLVLTWFLSTPHPGRGSGLHLCLQRFTSPATLSKVWYMNASIITPNDSVPTLTPPSAQHSRTNARTKTRARQGNAPTPKAKQVSLGGATRRSAHDEAPHGIPYQSIPQGLEHTTTGRPLRRHKAGCKRATWTMVTGQLAVGEKNAVAPSRAAQQAGRGK